MYFYTKYTFSSLGEIALWHYQVCDSLRDLAPYAQFKNREKHPRRSFLRFLNCTNGTKSRNASHIMKFPLLIYMYLLSKTFRKTDTQMFICRNPNHWNIPVCFVEIILITVENNAQKLRNLKNLKLNLSKYHCPAPLIKEGVQNTLSIPQKDLQKLKES